MINLDDDCLWKTGHAFSEMRLMVEGAIALFEDEATPLSRLAREAEAHEASSAFNDIGTALYAFRTHIVDLQDAHRRATAQGGNGC